MRDIGSASFYLLSIWLAVFLLFFCTGHILPKTPLFLVSQRGSEGFARCLPITAFLSNFGLSDSEEVKYRSGVFVALNSVQLRFTFHSCVTVSSDTN